MFRRNISLPSSGSKSKRSKKRADQAAVIFFIAMFKLMFPPFHLYFFLLICLCFEVYNTWQSMHVVLKTVLLLISYTHCFHVSRRAKLNSVTRFRKHGDASHGHEKISTRHVHACEFLLFCLFTTKLVNNTWDARRLDGSLWIYECITYVGPRHIRTSDQLCSE
jgi:hypothetical protein